jgi:hypothetical protein
MIERHYARSIVDGLEELAAKAVVPLVSHNYPVPPDAEDLDPRAPF